MFRIPGQALIFGMAIASLYPAGAQAAEDALAIVTGLAPGDLLNVRADASPVGHTRTRLANGASVKNSGCGDFGGYQWCKIAVVDQPGVDGWVPERYLLAVDPEGTATPSLDQAEIEEGTHDASTPGATEQGDTGGEKDASAAPALPSNLAARFGDGPPPAAGGQERDAPAGLTAAETEAYRAAYAARAKAEAARKNAGGEAGPESSEIGSAGDETHVASDAGEPTVPRQAGVASDVPVPTPRPGLKSDEAAGQMAEGAKTTDKANAHTDPASPTANNATRAPETPGSQIVALADPQPPPQTWDATGEIPCARYVGQPMTRCKVGVRREGDGKADVTVIWPDGGTLVIGFFDGKPAGVNSRGEFRFTREGDLNMIRVGVSERFEITDALAFGE